VVRVRFHCKSEGTYAGVLLHKSDEVPDELALIKRVRGDRGGAEAREDSHPGWRRAPLLIAAALQCFFVFGADGADRPSRSGRPEPLLGSSLMTPLSYPPPD